MNAKNDSCLDAGLIQAFVDGETTPERSRYVAEHCSECDPCALRLADVQDETLAVAALLDGEFNTMVPTQRLWTRISDAIETENRKTSLFGRLGRVFAVSAFTPSFAAMGGLLVLLSVLAGFAILSGGIGSTDPAAMTASMPRLDARSSDPPALLPAAADAASVDANESVVEAEPTVAVAVAAVPISRTSESSRRSAQHASFVKANGTASQRNAAAIRPDRTVYPVPDPSHNAAEASYIRTIAELSSNVDARKDAILDPSSRVAYEHDLALVSNAIDRMRAVVRKDPRNQAARQVLYSSYQDKIDLMNSVAAREELMASLQ